jgi:hypothetical protein
MAWWQRAPLIRHASAVAEVATRANMLVDEGVDDAEAVAQLRAMGRGPEPLQEAAQLMGRQINRGYPNTRVQRLLRAAAGDPLPALTDAQAAVKDQERRLWEQPFSVSFRQLTAQVPALEGLEDRLRSDPGSFLRGVTFRDTGRIGGPLPRADSREGQLLILRAIEKAVQRLVGPKSGLSDPVLASAAASRAATQHLREVAGIDPRSWRQG